LDLVDGEIQSRDRQRKHPLTHELARDAHPCCALLVAVSWASSVLPVPVKR
jgi:hypothetical protein